MGFGFLIFFVFGWAWFPNSRGYGRRWSYYGSDEDDAIQTLRRRYGRGEITKEQLEEMTKDLEQLGQILENKAKPVLSHLGANAFTVSNRLFAEARH